MTLDELFQGSNYDISGVQARLVEIAREEGLPFLDNHNMTYNSRNAQELAKWAEGLGKGEAFHDAAFRAVFAHDRNIGQDEVLLELAGSIGLDKEEADRVLTDESFGEAVDRDWEYCRKLGVTAVPTFIYGGRAIVGAQPYEALKKLVEEPGKGPSPFNMLRSG
ncbi:hypothetical protein LCGC14_2396740 [marine sediment metagenome]|uniref:DSBA-like thioredoxin domain-containing protein n=1 Tax=marine sediment metagenome TaxID=412755 RepID=A0A0F9CIN1_9ZZZZ